MIRGGSGYFAGDAARGFDVPGFAEGWQRVQKIGSFRATGPDLG